MKNILIIGSGYGAIPAVDGGAIATLIDMYLEKNEEEYNNKVVVYSALSKKINKNMNTENVEYRYINTSESTCKIERILRGVITRTLKLYTGNGYINRVIKDLKNKKEFNNYDIVIIENIGKYSILLNKYFKDKLVLHLHNDYLNVNTKFKEKILQNCNSVWGVSKFICNRVKEIDRENNYNTKIELLYNGVDINKFSEGNSLKEKEIRKKYNINEDDFVFLYTGRIYDKKGVKELIEAYRKFLNNNKETNSKLLIVGSIGYNQKEYLQNIKKIASEYSENIKFTGMVEYKDMPSIYNIANVQFIPSLCEEAFGLVVIEGISAGIPVVISNSGGMPEIIDNDNKVIVRRENIIDDLYEMMNKLYKNDKLIKEIIQKQFIAIKKFNKENYCNNFQQLIENFK